MDDRIPWCVVGSRPQEHAVSDKLADTTKAITRGPLQVVAALADHESAKAMWLKATGRVR